MTTWSDGVARLTGPGAPFEMVEEAVRGLPMRNFKNRERSLREKVANAALRGDQVGMVQGERRISYGEFGRLVWGAGHALRDGFGLARGDRLAVLDMKVVDEQGREVADGGLGQIVFYGPTVTPGYWKRPEATAEALVEGWLQTGDLGYRDPDGFFFVVDRAKDMILRGGENVYCVEIEHCLADHPEIDEAAIVGVPDVELGERVKAVVRRTPGSSLAEAAVRQHVAAHLASFKVPEIVTFVDDPLPRNPAGKLLENLLRGRGKAPFASGEVS